MKIYLIDGTKVEAKKNYSTFSHLESSDRFFEAELLNGRKLLINKDHILAIATIPSKPKKTAYEQKPIDESKLLEGGF